MLVTQSCRLFVTPWTVARQAPLSMGFSRQECWSGLSCPPPGDRPDPGIESMCPTLQADSSSFEPLGKPHKVATKRSNCPKHWKMQCYEILPGHSCPPIGHSMTGQQPRMSHPQVLIKVARAHRTHGHHGVTQLQAPQGFCFNGLCDFMEACAFKREMCIAG